MPLYQQLYRFFSHPYQLIKKLFDGGAFHCHRAGRAVKLAGFRIACGEVDGQCVAVSCHRHVPPPRRSPSGGFSELLLLAVDRGSERRGHGRALVAAVLRDSLDQRSPELLVVSTGHAFWQQPHLGLSDRGDHCGHPIFIPWSAGIQLVGRAITAQAADDLDAVCNEATAGFTQVGFYTILS